MALSRSLISGSAVAPSERITPQQGGVPQEHGAFRGGQSSRGPRYLHAVEDAVVVDLQHVFDEDGGFAERLTPGGHGIVLHQFVEICENNTSLQWSGRPAPTEAQHSKSCSDPSRFEGSSRACQEGRTVVTRSAAGSARTRMWRDELWPMRRSRSHQPRTSLLCLLASPTCDGSPVSRGRTKHRLRRACPFGADGCHPGGRSEPSDDKARSTADGALRVSMKGFGIAGAETLGRAPPRS
jgi:hypothetical protein